VQDTPSPASGDVTSAAEVTVTGKSTLRPPPASSDVTSVSHCDVTGDNAVDTGNRQRYKKPAEQYVIRECAVGASRSQTEESVRGAETRTVYSVRRQKRESVVKSDTVRIVKSQSPVKSSSYDLKGIECMTVTTVEVIVILQMAVIVRL
jgi:hypothetical protein